MIVIWIIILIILAFVYIRIPLWAKIAVLIINAFVPDPIPVLDEVIMLVATINNAIKYLKIITILEWINPHKILTCCIILGIFIFIIIIILKLIG